MRKNNDGYVLPFVLVVMIVLCIISTSLMTAALRNLQMQQKFTERMVDKYVAQGEIEKAVAQLQQDLLTQDIVIEGNVSGEPTVEELASKLGLTADKVRIIEATQANTETEEDETSEADEQETEKKPFAFTVSLDASSEEITIACELLISAEYTSAQQADSKYTCTITVERITYQSYEISTGGGT